MLELVPPDNACIARFLARWDRGKLALLAGYRGRWIQVFRQLWFVWSPGAIALIMFACIHVDPHFLGGWLVMLFAGVVCACVLPPDAGTFRADRCIGTAALITAGAAVILKASREAVGSTMRRAEVLRMR